MIDLFKISYKAHQDYVVSHIENKENKFVYIQYSNFILKIQNFNELPKLLKYYLEEVQREEQRWYSIFLLHNKYKLMAIEHALEITENLNKRFNEGWSKAYILPERIK